jgi:hypothetical protein
MRSKTRYKISVPSAGLTLEPTFSVVDTDVTGVDRSDQMLSYYTFVRKAVKWRKKLFFHLFDLAAVNAHILSNKSSKEKCLEIFYEKVAEGLLASADTEIQALGQISSPAGRLVVANPFLYRIPATHVKPEGKPQRLCRKRQAQYRENCDKLPQCAICKL